MGISERECNAKEQPTKVTIVFTCRISFYFFFFFFVVHLSD